ncbi:hypothetical protein QUH73_20590 [Labilibaculum sp. K2S]|uniref:hypothetical protein n=1 Tax=Labilibaculum sp. K2S TaxID=3056386 RepID=UPI0025A3E03E|nr:hypothetical protein [Labilibaculum sp. K2S]MDM8162224.1 hypothetical protein [Labilibaculum sp. K2S]
MKKKIILAILPISIVLILIYLISDNKLYYYGESRVNIFKHNLPLNLEPNYWDSDYCIPIIGFVIEYNKTVFIGKEVEYNYLNDTIVVNEIIRYGFNHDTLIAQIEDTKGENYYIECVRSKTNRIQENVLDKTVSIDTVAYNWVEIKSNKAIKLRRVQGYTLLLLIILIPLIILGSFILKKAKKANQENM